MPHTVPAINLATDYKIESQTNLGEGFGSKWLESGILLMARSPLFSALLS